MAKSKADGVNATRASAAVGKGSGNNYESRSYRRSLSIDTHEPLATQLPARPPSRESIISQDGDGGGVTAASFESQEGLATQFAPSDIRQNIPNATHHEPSNLKNTFDTGMLLGLLDRGNGQKPLPEQQSQRSVVESSYKGTKQTSTTDLITTSTQNNVRSGRSPSKTSINGSRPKYLPKQQSQRLASSPSLKRRKQTPTPDMDTSISSNDGRDGRIPSENVINGNRHESSPEHQPQTPDPTTSSDLDKNDERDGQEDDAMIPSQSRNAINSSQSQRNGLISQRSSSQKSKKSSEKRIEKIDMNSEDEVTSFQVRLPSSSDNTAPLTPNDGKPVDSLEERSDVTLTRLTEPARREKSFNRDPWSNMKKLRRRDIFIPEEQEELLERNDCWIPPDVGQPYPQGHVPLTMLWEWNTKMTRLFAEARKTHAPSQQAHPSHEHGNDQAPSWRPQTDESEMESESESEIPWSPSPPRDHPKFVAPPDSPARQDDDRRPAAITENHFIGTPDIVNGANTEIQAGSPLSTSRVEPDTHGANVSTVNNSQNCDSKLSPKPRSTVQSPPGDRGYQDGIAEMSDDSDMETAVPQALLVDTQDIASQIEFSGPLVPDSSNASSTPAVQVQILNTPAAALKRAAAQRVENVLPHSEDWAAQQSSYGSNKSSSQLIVNSLNSTEGSSVQEDQLQDAQRPLVADSQITNSGLQGSSLSSHQDSQRLLEVIPDSSLQSTGRRTEVSPQRHETPKDRIENASSPSTAMVIGNGLKRRAAEIEDGVIEESPSKRARNLTDRTTNASRIQNTVDVHLNAVDKGNHEYVPMNKDALRVYDMFKRSYPKYAGDFAHFQALCFKLQSLHSRGLLESSILWDDFVMRNWVDYGSYVQKCIFSGEEYDSYEDFFCNNFTKPSFRKRNLTPRTLHIVVSSRLEFCIQKPITIGRGMQTIDDNSVSSSVIRPSVTDQDSKSILKEPNTQSTTSDVLEVVDRPHQANIGVKLSALSASPKKQSIVIGGGIQVDLQPPTPTSGLDGEPEHVLDTNRAIEETPPPAAIINDDRDHDMKEATPDDFTSDYHDTASIELGLDVMEEILVSHQDNDEDENGPNNVEARFEQISRMRRDDAQAIQALFMTEIPPVPEEEDPSTPFKTWARDDHNIGSERRRRGGHEVPVDKNGNIVVEEFSRVIDEEKEQEVRSPLRRWNWPRRP